MQTQISRTGLVDVGFIVGFLCIFASATPRLGTLSFFVGGMGLLSIGITCLFLLVEQFRNNAHHYFVAPGLLSIVLMPLAPLYFLGYYLLVYRNGLPDIQPRNTHIASKASLALVILYVPITIFGGLESMFYMIGIIPVIILSRILKQALERAPLLKVSVASLVVVQTACYFASLKLATPFVDDRTGGPILYPFGTRPFTSIHPDLGMTALWFALLHLVVSLWLIQSGRVKHGWQQLLVTAPAIALLALQIAPTFTNVFG